MSVAEKLRALDEAMHPGPWRPKKGNAMQSPMVLEADVTPFDSTASAPGMAALRNALPQIVAVVEAAELEAALAIINDDRETTLGHALTALDEALP